MSKKLNQRLIQRRYWGQREASESSYAKVSGLSVADFLGKKYPWLHREGSSVNEWNRWDPSFPEVRQFTPNEWRQR
jgi:hypothetical protein